MMRIQVKTSAVKKNHIGSHFKAGSKISFVWLFSCLFRKLRSLSEGRVVVQLLRTFKFEWSLVQRRTLPQPLPRWSLLGRVQGRSLFAEESGHDDPSEPQYLPLIGIEAHGMFFLCFFFIKQNSWHHFHQTSSWKCNIETSGWHWSPYIF